ncbi:MAG TPA: MFS transporter [Leadbetterella sp.]|nr:MFS transporter [Leadbetterella sp.]
MKNKIQNKYITLIMAILGYFSNSFIVNLPYVISDPPFLDLRFSPANLVDANLYLLIIQHLGILVGALVFSFWVDKKSRLFILLVSVFTYSFATFLGGLVNNYYLFLLLKFITGFGLAPELGIGMVLVSELFERKKNSLLVGIIAMSGCIAVIILSISSKIYSWRDIYIYSGLGSMLIMLTRFASFESDLFLKIKHENDSLDSVRQTLTNRKFYLLLLCMLPIYVITAGSIFLTADIYEQYKIVVEKNTLTMCFGVGAIFGFIIIPILTHKFKSRKLIIKICIFALLLISLTTSINNYFGRHGMLSFQYFYTIVTLYGIFSGYLFEFFIFALEQYGTNRRASATTLLFSFARSSVFIFSLVIPYLNHKFFHSFLNTLLFLEAMVFAGAIWSIYKLDESYNKDLDFID